MKPWIVICIMVNLFFLMIDPFLAVIFLLLWPAYTHFHKLRLSDEL